MSASRKKKEPPGLRRQRCCRPQGRPCRGGKAKQRKSTLLLWRRCRGFRSGSRFGPAVELNVIQRGKTALTIGDENYSAAQVQYSYYAAYTEVRSSNYYSYMGIDTSKSLAGQDHVRYGQSPFRHHR